MRDQEEENRKSIDFLYLCHFEIRYILMFDNQMKPKDDQIKFLRYRNTVRTGNIRRKCFIGCFI